MTNWMGWEKCGKSRSSNVAYTWPPVVPRNRFPRTYAVCAGTSRKSFSAQAEPISLKLSRQLCLAFKQTPSDGSEDKAADVRQVRHPSRLNLRNRACVEELCEEPKANQQRGRDERDPPKNEDKQNSANFISRISDHECAHDRGNRAGFGTVE